MTLRLSALAAVSDAGPAAARHLRREQRRNLHRKGRRRLPLSGHTGAENVTTIGEADALFGWIWNS